MNFIYFDLYYTVIKYRNDKEIVSEDEYENEYNNFDVFITRNLYIGRKHDDVLLR